MPPSTRRQVCKRHVLEGQAMQWITHETTDIPCGRGAGYRDILKPYVFEYWTVALERLKINVASSVWNQRVVSQRNAHEISSATVWRSVRISPELAHLDSPVCVVHKRAGIGLVALVLDRPARRALVISNLAVLHQQIKNSAVRRGTKAEVAR